MSQKKETGMEGGKVSVVLKMGMYCHACADKAEKSVKGFTGVEEKEADMASNKLKLVVRKDVDPWKLRDRVAAKMRKKVDLVSLTRKPHKKTKPDDKKRLTVVRRISLHCNGGSILKTIWGIKGVEHVALDEERGEVTVMGTMDAKALPGGPQGEAESAGGGGTAAGGGGTAAGGGGVGEQWGGFHQHVYDPLFGMMPQHAPAPQMFIFQFSDENPNAYPCPCSIL